MVTTYSMNKKGLLKMIALGKYSEIRFKDTPEMRTSPIIRTPQTDFSYTDMWINLVIPFFLL